MTIKGRGELTSGSERAGSEHRAPQRQGGGCCGPAALALVQELWKQWLMDVVRVGLEDLQREGPAEADTKGCTYFYPVSHHPT